MMPDRERALRSVALLLGGAALRAGLSRVADVLAAHAADEGPALAGVGRARGVGRVAVPAACSAAGPHCVVAGAGVLAGTGIGFQAPGFPRPALLVTGVSGADHATQQLAQRL